MASRSPEELNDSLETYVESALKKEQQTRLERASREPLRRRKSPFATVVRSSHSPRPTYHPPRTSDLDSVANSRPRYSEDTGARAEEERSAEPELKETAEGNCCLSVALSLLTIVGVCAIFAFSWVSTNAVK